MKKKSPLRFTVRALALLLLAAPLAIGAAAPTVSACSPIPSSEVELADLLAADFNEPDSAMVERIINDAWIDTADPFTIQGAYLTESVLTVEGDDDWTRGSVIVVAQTWGEQPDDVAPRTFEGQPKDADDPCGPFAGPPLGRRQIVLITSPDEISDRLYFSLAANGEQATFEALTSALGQPVTIDRDSEEEERLLGLLQDQRPSSQLPLFIAGGGAVALAGAGFFAYRTRTQRRQRTQLTEF